MEQKDYFKDLKNLQPKPLDQIPWSSVRRTIKNQPPKKLKEIRNMEPLNNSKTLWGFGIAVFIYILQNILTSFNIAGPDNMLVKVIIEAVIAIAGFFGVYGIRDALRKMTL